MVEIEEEGYASTTFDTRLRHWPLHRVVNVKGVQQMLGHASVQMNLDRYAGLFDGHLDDVVDCMSVLFVG